MIFFTSHALFDGSAEPRDLLLSAPRVLPLLLLKHQQALSTNTDQVQALLHEDHLLPRNFLRVAMERRDGHVTLTMVSNSAGVQVELQTQPYRATQLERNMQ